MNNIIRNYLNMAVAISLSLGAYTVLAAPICKNNIMASTPSSDFIDNNDGTITHKTTGLMWKKCPEGLEGADCATYTVANKNWKEALEMANTSTFAGYDDWRLPNIKELNSIVERRCSYPTINKNIFPNPNATSGIYRSSSYDVSGNGVFIVDFRKYQEMIYNKNSVFRLRLVRSR